MFNVVKYQSDQITGKVEVVAFFQLKQNGNINQIGGTYSTDQSAKNFLRKEMTGYILCKLENYIVHKKNIIENPPYRNKSHIPKEEALKECLAYLKYAAEKQDLYETCKWGVLRQQYLEKILPSENNPSYTNSKKDLEEIIDFCKQHQHGAILKKAC